MTIRIKNWARFQHFKDRKPPWIKLYRDLLDDIKWHELDSDAAKLLVSLWLLASETDGVLPHIKELAFRLRCSEKSIKSNISKLDHWLIHDDINAISDITPISSEYQADSDMKALARSRETETETETERTQSVLGIKTLTGLGVDEQIARDWMAVRKAKRAPLTDTALKELESEAAKAGITPAQAIKICAKRSWQGFNATWNWQDDLLRSDAPRKVAL